MKVSKYRKANDEALVKEAIELYKTGLSTRQVGKKLSTPRSYQWVWKIVCNLE